MRIHRLFTGSKLWDCEPRLAFKFNEAKIQSNEGNKGKEPKKDLKDYVARIADKHGIANTVYDFLKNDSVIDPQKEVMELRRAIEGKIREDPDIQKMTVAELDALMKGIPDDQNKLVGFLFANGIIEAVEYNNALALGVQNRPKTEAKNSNTKADVGTPNIQSKSGVMNSPIDATSKTPSEPTEEVTPRAKAKSSPADKGSIVKDEKYWNERVVREREKSEQFKSDVADRFKNVTPKNKDVALANLREEMGEMQEEMEQLERDRINVLNQKMLNRPDAARRYSGARRQQMGEAYQKYSAELRDIGSRLIPLTREYNLLNEQHMRLSGGKRFGEWKRSSGDYPEYAEKLNQQQKRDQTLAMKNDREYEEEQSRAARSKAEGDRVLGIRSRDPVASYFAGKSAENRARVAEIMGWPSTGNGSVTENDVRFAGQIESARNRGVNVVRRGSNYAYIDRTGKVGKFQNGGRSSASDDLDGSSNALPGATFRPNDAGEGAYEKTQRKYIESQGGAKFMKEQNKLREGYADRMMENGGLEEKFKEVIANDPRAKNVIDLLKRRSADWGDHPGDRYGDLAWARSQLEAFEKAQGLEEYMNNNEHREMREKKPLREYVMPVNTVDPYWAFRVSLPLDADGRKNEVIVQPNRLELFWGKNNAQQLLEAGVWFEKVRWQAGNLRALNFHFTKPGRFSVNGKTIDVVESPKPAPPSAPRSAPLPAQKSVAAKPSGTSSLGEGAEFDMPVMKTAPTPGTTEPRLAPTAKNIPSKKEAVVIPDTPPDPDFRETPKRKESGLAAFAKVEDTDDILREINDDVQKKKIAQQEKINNARNAKRLIEQNLDGDLRSGLEAATLRRRGVEMPETMEIDPKEPAIRRQQERSGALAGDPEKKTEPKEKPKPPPDSTEDLSKKYWPEIRSQEQYFALLKDFEALPLEQMAERISIMSPIPEKAKNALNNKILTVDGLVEELEQRMKSAKSVAETLKTNDLQSLKLQKRR